MVYFGKIKIAAEVALSSFFEFKLQNIFDTCESYIFLLKF